VSTIQALRAARDRKSFEGFCFVLGFPSIPILYDNLSYNCRINPPFFELQSIMLVCILIKNVYPFFVLEIVFDVG